MIRIILFVCLFLPATSLVAQPAAPLKFDTVKFSIEKHCESMYELVDARQAPRAKRVYKYKAMKLKPNIVNDSVVAYNQNIKGLLVDVTIRTGMVKITQPLSYYTGHDADKLPAYAQGVKQLELKVNKRVIPLQFDHILHVDPKSILVMKDLTSPKIFIFLSNGEGAGTDHSFWIIYSNKVMGHYDWEYGYDEWSPRNNLDAFQLKAPLDKCAVYKISGLY